MRLSDDARQPTLQLWRWHLPRGTFGDPALPSRLNEISQDNVEIIRAMYAELNATYKRGDDLHRAHETGDFGDFIEQAERILHDDVVLSTPDDSPWPEGATGEWRGREEFLRFLFSQTEAFEEMFIETSDFIDAGDRVVVPARFGGRARHSGLEVEFPIVHVLTLDGGRIKRLDMYMSRTEALRAVGLEES